MGLLDADKIQRLELFGDDTWELLGMLKNPSVSISQAMS